MSFLEKVKNEESFVLAIDFDGVIHKNSKGFHDGTVYDEPIEGACDAIKFLSEKFKIIIFSCKALPDRPVVEGMNGEEHIWMWLKKYNIDKYIYKVTSEKPRALFYIDDKAITFNNWDSVLKRLGCQNV